MYMRRVYVRMLCSDSPLLHTSYSSCALPQKDSSVGSCLG
jgi:hypothetical protein